MADENDANPEPGIISNDLERVERETRQRQIPNLNDEEVKTMFRRLEAYFKNVYNSPPSEALLSVVRQRQREDGRVPSEPPDVETLRTEYAQLFVNAYELMKQLHIMLQVYRKILDDHLAGDGIVNTVMGGVGEAFARAGRFFLPRNWFLNKRRIRLEIVAFFDEADILLRKYSVDYDVEQFRRPFDKYKKWAIELTESTKTILDGLLSFCVEDELSHFVGYNRYSMNVLFDMLRGKFKTSRLLFLYNQQNITPPDFNLITTPESALEIARDPHKLRKYFADRKFGLEEQTFENSHIRLQFAYAVAGYMAMLKLDKLVDFMPMTETQIGSPHTYKLSYMMQPPLFSAYNETMVDTRKLLKPELVHLEQYKTNDRLFQTIVDKDPDAIVHFANYSALTMSNRLYGQSIKRTTVFNIHQHEQEKENLLRNIILVLDHQDLLRDDLARTYGRNKGVMIRNY